MALFLVVSTATQHSFAESERFVQVIHQLEYMGTSLIRKDPPLGPFRRPIPRVLGGWVFSYERDTPVKAHASIGSRQREVNWWCPIATPLSFAESERSAQVNFFYFITLQPRVE